MTIQNRKLDKLVMLLSLIDLQEDEVWKEIDFIENVDSSYFVSNYGYVISLYRNKPILLQPFSCGNGYLCVSICGKDYKIHRLVATAFCPNPENKPIVHHKDHDKWNNKSSNLVWATQQENVIAYFDYKKELSQL